MGAITSGYWRAVTDNDRPLNTLMWQNFGLDALTSSLRSVRVDRSSADEFVLTAVTAVAPPILDWRFVTTTTYRVVASGQIHISTHVKPEGCTPATMPRVELDLRIADTAFDYAHWFGPGPGQSYSDAKVSQKLGI